MRNIAPRLTFAAAVALLLLISALAVKFLLERSGRQARSPLMPAGPPDSVAGADRLRQAVATLQRRRSIIAKVRHSVDLFGVRMQGSGQYVQGAAAPRSPRLVPSRWELKLQAGDQTGTWLQVCDGSKLWTYRKQPESARLTRIDALRVLASEQSGGPTVDPGGWLLVPVGGLADMLAGLARTMDFQHAVASDLGGLPVWVVQGEWNRAFAGRVLRGQAASIEQGAAPDFSELPPHLPDHALIYLGQSDLFPYRVVLARHDGETARPLVVLELYEVEYDSPIDPAQFVYKPGGKRTHDETDGYIEARAASRTKGK
jgi:hypothetical protein